MELIWEQEAAGSNPAIPTAVYLGKPGDFWLLATLPDAPLAAVNLPGPVSTLDHVQRDRTGHHYRALAVAAALTPSLIRYPGNAAVPCEPLGRENGSRLPIAVRYQRERES